jgi:gliding motility-associated-like protein
MKILSTIVLLGVFFLTSNALCQLDTIFWFVAPEVTSAHGDRPIVFRFNSLAEPAEVVVSQPANPAFPTQTINLAANSSQTLDLLDWIDIIENKPYNTVLNYGFKITSTAPITAYYEITPTCQCNPDIMALKGKNALGTSFFVAGQTFYNNGTNYEPNANAKFDIVATEDNTTVTIIPSNDIFGHAAGIPFTITLNAGQTFSGVSISQSAGFKVVGTIITSDKPIAVTYSDDSVAFNTCRDILSDQLIPTNLIGTDYIAVRGFLQTMDRIFVTATQNNTQVFINNNPVPVATLNSAQTHMIELTAPSVFIQCSEPAYVFHVSGFGCEVGGAILPPIVCTGSFVVPFVRSTSEFFGITLLVKAGNEGAFLLDGLAGIINAGNFNFVPGTNDEWMYAQINMSSTIAVNQGVRIENTADRFHLGIINGGSSSGCRFGFFSDFSSLNYTIQADANSVCEYGSVTLSTPELPGATYDWTGPNGFSAQGQSINLNNLSINQSGYYTVSGSLPNACPLSPDSIFIQVNPNPEFLSASFQDLCDGQNVSIANQVNWNGPSGSVSINFGDGNNGSNVPSPTTHTYPGFGIYNAILSASTPSGCTDQLNLSVQVDQTPTVFTSSSSYCTNLVNFSSQIDMGASSQSVQNFWWIIENDSISNIANPAVTVNLETGTYNGIFGITTSGGCKYTYDFQFFVDESLNLEGFTLPNVITPNNDGANDLFLVDEIFDDCVPYEIDFLNRWGQVIYTMTSNANAFAGVDNKGVEISDGVYFYNFKSPIINTHGFVHVVRE